MIKLSFSLLSQKVNNLKYICRPEGEGLRFATKILLFFINCSKPKFIFILLCSRRYVFHV